jgi:hypothetical protein
MNNVRIIPKGTIWTCSTSEGDYFIYGIEDTPYDDTFKGEVAFSSITLLGPSGWVAKGKRMQGHSTQHWRPYKGKISKELQEAIKSLKLTLYSENLYYADEV